MFFVSACSTHSLHRNEKQSQLHFQVGLSHFEDRDYPQALSEFQRALELDEGSSSILMHIGLAYLKMDKLEQAETRVRQACTLKEAFPECWNNLAYIQLRQHEPNKAAISAQKALAFDTYQTPEIAYENLSRAQIDLKQYAPARKNLEKALRIRPESCELRMTSALLLVRQGDFDEALRESKRTVFLCKLDPRAHLWEAYCEYRLGNRSLAEKKYNEILDLFNRADAADAARVAIDRLKNRIPLEEPPQMLGDS